jgi:two-component system nitrogen regulation response regulator GlnG
LFLDEIGATPAEVQPLLLRALDSYEIQPLGNVGPRRVDVRLITATDADMEQAIAAGLFRSALLHRLEGYQLAVPPLRERREDFGRLLIHFVRAELGALGELDRLAPRDDAAAPWLPAALVARLARLDWPGNIRQLRNATRQLCIASRGQPTAHADATLERLVAVRPTSAIDSAPEPQSINEEAVRTALRVCDYRIGDAAVALGVSRSWLYNHVRDNPRIRQAKDLSRDEIEKARIRCGGDVASMARDLEVSRRALTIRIRDLELADE